MSCPVRKCQKPDCENLAFCLAETRTLGSRNANVSKAIAQQERQDTAREFAGVYVGFDAKSGNDLIRLPSGGIVRAAPVSNGIAKPESLISGVLPLGSVTAFVDRMPR